MALQQQRQINLYDKVHTEYEERYSLQYSMIFHKYWNRTLLKYFPKERDIKILEIACGTGVLLQDLKEEYDYVVGADISFAMVKEIGKILHLSRIVVCDATKLPFGVGFFDVVICRGSLHHFPSLDLALEEICRTLKTY